jgi:hypothetical protein
MLYRLLCIFSFESLFLIVANRLGIAGLPLSMPFLLCFCLGPLICVLIYYVNEVYCLIYLSVYLLILYHFLILHLFRLKLKILKTLMCINSSLLVYFLL